MAPRFHGLLDPIDPSLPTRPRALPDIAHSVCTSIVNQEKTQVHLWFRDGVTSFTDIAYLFATCAAMLASSLRDAAVSVYSARTSPESTFYVVLRPPRNTHRDTATIYVSAFDHSGDIWIVLEYTRGVVMEAGARDVFAETSRLQPWQTEQMALSLHDRLGAASLLGQTLNVVGVHTDAAFWREQFKSAVDALPESRVGRG